MLTKFSCGAHFTTYGNIKSFFCTPKTMLNVNYISFFNMQIF